MGYSAVKGGADAIRAAEELIAHPLLDADEAPLDTRQLRHQLGLAADKVMGEGGLYAPELAALALKQAEGDLFEAAFLLRAYRSTLPRFGYALPAHGRAMRTVRRISSAFKDIPGGQLLGRTRDYTQRLLDFARLGRGLGSPAPTNGAAGPDLPTPNGERPELPKVSDVMRAMGLVPPLPERAPEAVDPPDITLESMRFPVPRPARLQALARGESGAMVCLAYSSLRGFGGKGDHGTVAELRVGDLPLRVVHPLTGRPVTVGWYRVTEAELVGQSHDRAAPGRALPSCTLSYGLVFGQHERKALAMAILDSTLQAAPAQPAGRGEAPPANDQEMVLSHIDGVESAGFVEHLKLPHYVTFGSSLQGMQELPEAPPPLLAAPRESAADEHERGSAPGQLHHHGDGVLHAHDE